jgi:cobalt-precorrin 5A hydrolase
MTTYSPQLNIDKSAKPAALIISLTKQGQQLAQKCLQFSPDAEHQHCPKPFKNTVHTAFQAARPLIFITAVGIAVRTLATVIDNKYSDPPVLVLDQYGKFVIPLLSGHEGGANRWGQQLADYLGAQAIITTAQTYTHNGIVAGMGSDRGCPTELLHEILLVSLKKINASIDEVCAISSIDHKKDEQGMIALAKQLNIPFICYSVAELRQVEAYLTQRSEIVFREVGVYGVAEAAAIVYAKQQPHFAEKSVVELIVPKQKNRRATCAIACF